MRQYLEYLLHLVRLAVGTGQLYAGIRYALVALIGAVIDVALFLWLVGRAGWRPAAALPVAIEVALVSNFAWSEIFTFRSAKSSRFRHGVLKSLLRYERICIPGALLNMVVTLPVISQGGGLITGAAVGVVSGGAYNFFFNIPAIWRTWNRLVEPPSPAG